MESKLGHCVGGKRFDLWLGYRGFFFLKKKLGLHGFYFLFDTLIN